jgi:ParB family chromosome partitioning protein
MGSYRKIPLSKLKVSRENARHLSADKKADKELLASLAKHGQFQNLVVSPIGEDGMHEIYAGKRRFSAFQILVKQGDLDPDAPIDCKVERNKNKLAEITLAENVARAAMHPVDELAAFNRLHAEKGYRIDQIAEHFGKPKAEIKRILALGGCAPMLLDKCREGELSIDALRAFSLTTDQDKQIAVYESLKKSQGRVHAWSIKEALSEKLIKSTEPIALFVGLNTYKNKGGTFQKDLFNSTTYLADPDLLQRLADEKFAEILKSEVGEGWGWVECMLEHYVSDIKMMPQVETSVTAEGKKTLKKLEQLNEKLSSLDVLDQSGEYDELLEQIEQLEADLIEQREDFNSEQRKNSGVIIALDRDGNVCIYRGLLKPGQVVSSSDSNSGESSPTVTDRAEYSEAVLQDLKIYKTIIARLALIDEPQLAVELIHFQLIVSLINQTNFQYFESVIDLHFRSTETDTSRSDLDDNPAQLEILKKRDEIWQQIPEDWLKLLHDGNLGAAFARFLIFPEELKNKLLSDVAARSLVVANDLPGELLSMVGKAVRDWWHPTAANFFQRVRKETVINCASEIMGSDWADEHMKLPRKDLAIRLEEACQPGGKGCLWTPVPMITASAPVASSDSEQKAA